MDQRDHFRPKVSCDRFHNFIIYRYKILIKFTSRKLFLYPKAKYSKSFIKNNKLINQKFTGPPNKRISLIQRIVALYNLLNQSTKYQLAFKKITINPSQEFPTECASVLILKTRVQRQYIYKYIKT